MRSFLAGLTRIRLLNLREIRTHRLRVITSMSVVAVSSALLIAVLGTYGSLSESVRQFNAAITGVAQLEVAAISDAGVDDVLVTEIRRDVDGTRSVVPMIRSSVTVDDDTFTLLGSDFRVTALSGDLQGAMPVGEDGSVSLTQEDLADGVIVGAATGLTEGQRLQIHGVDVEVLDVVDEQSGAALNGGRFVFAYLDLAQRLVDAPGKVDSILIVTEPDADLGTVRTDVEAVVDGRAVVVDPDFRAKQAEASSAVTRDATLLVALVSLIIAAFLVFNTMNMAVASRRQSMAMLRALGAKRLHLVGDLLGESALFGLVGGLIGVPFGILAGRWTIGSVPDSTGSVSTAISYHLPLYVPVLAVVACVLACVAATALAARSVFAVSPVEAMSPGEVADSESRHGPLVWVSGAAAVAVLIVSFLMATQLDGQQAIAAGAVYAVGAILLCFALSGPLVWLVVRVARWFGGPGQLAAVNTERAPRRAWATLMTVAVAIAVGMGTSGALDNMVGSLSKSLDGLADPDFYVSSLDKSNVPAGPLLPSELIDATSEVPGVEQVVGSQWASVNADDARILIQGLVPASQAPFTRKISEEMLDRVLDGQGIILSTVLSRVLEVGVGDELTLATPTGYREVEVLDTVDYVTIESGTAALSNELLSEWFGREGFSYLQVSIAPDADPEQVRAGLEAVATANPLDRGRVASVYSGEEALEATQAVVEQAGAFTQAIQWIVAVAAAIALLNTLLLSVIERRRELGVLRAMGASRQFIGRMVLAEAGAVAIVGSVVGLLLGGVLHWVANQILTAATSVQVIYSPLLSTLVFVVVAVALCLIGAFFPAARAARLNISEAILAE